MKQSYLRNLIIAAFLIGFLAGYRIDINNSDTPPVWVALFTFFMIPFVYGLIVFYKNIINSHIEFSTKNCLFHPFKCPDKFYLIIGSVGIASAIGITTNNMITERGISFEEVFFFGGGISCLFGRYLGMRKIKKLCGSKRGPS